MSEEEKARGRAVKTVGLMMAATVIAKLLGMLRGVLQASAYGSLPEAEAFTAASKLPLAFFDMLLAAAVLGCFIPVYNSFKGDCDGGEGADDFACIFLNFIAIICGILALVGIIFADTFIGIIGGGLSPEMHTLAVKLTRIMFPMVIFTGSAYTLVGLLQSRSSFIAPAMISAISNGGVVIYLAVINPALGNKGIYGLAAAYLVSWLIQLLTLIIPLWRTGFRYRMLFDFKNPAFIRAIKMAPPIMVGSWLAPAGVLIGQYFASRLSAEGISGAAAIFDYANNIYIILAGTLTYSICNYTFPKISKFAAEGETEDFYSSIRYGLRSALFIIIPFASAAFVLAGEGVSILYLRGEFTPEDARGVTDVLRCIIPAMPFFAVIELLSRVFYSMGKPVLVMWAVLLGIAANIGSGAIFTWQGGLGISAVGASMALGQIVTAAALIIFAAKRLKGLFSRGMILEAAAIIAGGVIVFAICFFLSDILNGDPYSVGIFKNIINAVIVFVPGAAAYLLWSYICKKIKSKHLG